jgi:cell division protein FtsA
MKPNKNLIAAIELSSSRIAGIVGEKTDTGALRVHAYSEEDAETFIPKGIITNVEQAADAIKSIITNLELSLADTLKADDCSIDKVYIGVGGKSLHARLNTVVRRMDEEITISEALIDEMNIENESFDYPNMELMEVIAQEYKAGQQLHDNPKGVRTAIVEGHFLNIIAKRALKRNLEETFKEEGLEGKLLDTMLTPLTTAAAVLTPQEKKQGVGLLDFGAGTTTVSVYRGGKLRFLAVIPLGGENITRDICAHDNRDEDAAEGLKCRCGDALYVPAAEGMQAEDANSLRILNEIIGARAEEIVANVKAMLVQAEAEKLPLVLTGGAAQLHNLDKLVANMTGVAKLRLATEAQMDVDDTEEKLPADRNVYALLGMLTAATGKDNCVSVTTKAQTSSSNQSAEKGLFDDDPVVQPPKDMGESKRDRKIRENKERAEAKAAEKERKRIAKEERKKKEGPSIFKKLWDDMLDDLS